MNKHGRHAAASPVGEGTAAVEMVVGGTVLRVEVTVAVTEMKPGLSFLQPMPLRRPEAVSNEWVVSAATRNRFPARLPVLTPDDRLRTPADGIPFDGGRADPTR